jgi:hypothetical protein
METPRFLSEYFAAPAQSAGCISAAADVDVANARSKKLLSCGKHIHEDLRMCESRRLGQTPMIPVLQPESMTPDQHRQCQLEHVPSANGGYATLPHSAIRPGSEVQNDPEKIA